MGKDFKRHTVTAALPYANGGLHIGHMAGVYVPADIYVRYLRSKGEDVLFICGSDEHGVPVTIRAKQEGIAVQEVVDKYHTLIKDSFEKFDIAFDVYSRTSAPIHHKTASDFFVTLDQKNEFITQETEQYYDEEQNEFLADRYIIGTCPNCKFDGAYGDQCENCGSTLSPRELLNPRSALSGNNPILKSTKHWYLPLDAYEPWLKKYILEDHKDWKVNVYGQCKSWLDNGLKPRAVTRDLSWGIPVPRTDAEGKVLYVWFDAPIGYISATKELAESKGFDWKPYWQSEDSKLVHFIGKDNIVFHSLIFPAMLKAHGDFIVPENVPANEFLNLEGNKISTSRNWAVWLHEYLEDFEDKQDVLRYVLTANAPETKDNDFTWKDFQARNNNELVAVFGNFVNRTLVLMQKYYEGKLPALGELNETDKALIESIKKAPIAVSESIDSYRFREALSRMMELARAGNKYLAETEPWKLIKTDPKKVETILHLSAQLVANLAIISAPFIPFTSKKLFQFLNIEVMDWSNAGRVDLLENYLVLNKPSLLFEKIEDKQVQDQIGKLEATKLANMEDVVPAEAPLMDIKETIQYDDFMKIDMRVGTILEAEKVPKSNKLLKLLVDTGVDQRVILSGIAKHFEIEDLIGKQGCVLVNLAPRKMMGTESNGMLLLAENPDGTLVLVSPPEGATNGSSIA